MQDKIEPKNSNDVNFIRIYLDVSLQGIKKLCILAFDNNDDRKVEENSHKLFSCQIVDITDYNFFLIFYNQPIEDKIKKIDEIRKITTG